MNDDAQHRFADLLHHRAQGLAPGAAIGGFGAGTLNLYLSGEPGKELIADLDAIGIAKDAKHHDLKEFWHVGRDLPEGSPLADASMPPNVWPRRRACAACPFRAPAASPRC